MDSYNSRQEQQEKVEAIIVQVEHVLLKQCQFSQKAKMILQRLDELEKKLNTLKKR